MDPAAVVPLVTDSNGETTIEYGTFGDLSVPVYAQVVMTWNEGINRQRVQGSQVLELIAK